MNSIYLLGSERSGSNLLRVLLGNHSKISAPVAPHFGDVFYERFKYYFPLTIDRKVELFNDLQCYINHPFCNWSLTLDAQKLVSEYKLDSFPEIVHAIYSEKAKSDGKQWYMSKDNNNHRYALGILKDVKLAKFIYLFRDPRDQVASWLKTPVHLRTPYQIVNKWTSEQSACLQLNRYYNVHMHWVKYEDLVDNPEKVMKGLLTYLGLPIEEQCFSTNAGNTEAARHILWKNINKPIIKSNHGKFQDYLTGSSLNMVETIAKSLMNDLGYKCVSSCDWKMGNKYVFKIRERLTGFIAQRRITKISSDELTLLRERVEFVKSLFQKFK